MSDGTIALAAIGLVGTILGLVVKPLFELLNNNTDALKALVDETAKGNREAAERNGHLGEQNIQITELIAHHTEAMEKNFVNIDRRLSHQEVTEQIVEHQTIKKGR